MKQRRIALVDGNSFYASCHMAFDPSLWRRPVVVLSNNDGCIVAANAQAKALNKKLQRMNRHSLPEKDHLMFQPYFKLKAFLQAHNTAVFSSDYALYGEMSRRMHKIVGAFGRQQEVYSIDESFIELVGDEANLSQQGQQIKQRVWQWLTLPVAVGMASTKTLAKLANHWAKKQVQFNGVLDYCALPEVAQQTLLQQTPVGKVWGIGRQLREKLNQQGIQTAWDLKQSHFEMLRRRYSIVVAKIARELNGQACLSIESVRPPKQQIVSSRSFRQPIETQSELMSAIARFTAMAAEKLRAQGSVCQQISVSIRTNPFENAYPYYHPVYTLNLIEPTDHTLILTKYARQALEQIYQPGLPYKKAQVCLQKLTSKKGVQADLFHQRSISPAKSRQLMQAVDQINQQYGRQTIKSASSLSHSEAILTGKRKQVHSMTYGIQGKRGEFPTVRSG